MVLRNFGARHRGDMADVLDDRLIFGLQVSVEGLNLVLLYPYRYSVLVPPVTPYPTACPFAERTKRGRPPHGKRGKDCADGRTCRYIGQFNHGERFPMSPPQVPMHRQAAIIETPCSRSFRNPRVTMSSGTTSCRCSGRSDP